MPIGVLTIGSDARRSDGMVSRDSPGGVGAPTADPLVRVVPLADAQEQTERFFDGTSPVVARRVHLLDSVEDFLAL